MTHLFNKNMSERFGKHRITKGMRDKLREKTGNKCIYCGLELLPESLDKLNKRKVCNVEHFVPQAVYKWTAGLFSDEEVNKMREKCIDINNLVIVHYECNRRKNSEIPDINTIKQLKCSEELMKEYEETLRNNEKYIEKYKEVVKDILKNQDNKCKKCKRYLTVEKATLRRLNNKIDRSYINGVAMCNRCNRSFS